MIKAQTVDVRNSAGFVSGPGDPKSSGTRGWGLRKARTSGICGIT